jgi:hypothetical protein
MLPTIPKINREALVDLRMAPIQISWNRPRQMKKIVAASAPGPNMVVITDGAKIIVKVGDTR